MLNATGSAKDPSVELLQLDENVDGSGIEPISTQFIIAFDSLYFVGFFLLLVVLLTSWASSRIRRFSTWYMFLLAWLVEAFAKLLLVGQQTSPASPAFGLCVIQASLINASPVLCSSYAVAFILQTYLNVRKVLKSDTVVSRSHIRWLHTLPCAAFIGHFGLSFMLGLINRTAAQRSPLGIYCHFTGALAKEITAGLVIGLMTILLIFEVYLVIVLARAWKAAGRKVPRKDTEHLALGTFARVLLISTGPLIALILSSFQFISQRHEETVQLVLLQSIFPLMVALIFGSQKDIVHVWMFWKDNRSRSQQTV